MTRSPLTERQRVALAVFLEVPGRSFDAAELAKRLGTSREGAGMTAASLVKRGLVTRTRRDRRVAWVAPLEPVR